MNLLETRLLSEAVGEALRTTGRPVSMGEVSPDAALPYCDVWPVSDVLDGSLGNPDDDNATAYKVRYFGVTLEQAEWLRDRGRAAVKAVMLTGRRVLRVEVFGGRGAPDTETAAPTLFMVTDDYVFHTTPA